MNQWTDEKLRKALKTAFPPGAREEPSRDRWPQLLARMEAPGPRLPWLDWAVVALSGLLLLLLPAAAPILFYFL